MDNGWRRYLWLNLKAFAQGMLKQTQSLERVKYFTARMSGPSEKQRDQTTYLEALETLDGLDIRYGHFRVQEKTCRKCGNKTYVPSEKMTDVNIAVEMMRDAFDDNFDTALLVSADSDLVPPIRAIHELNMKRRIVIAFPLRRFSEDLKTTADASFQIGRTAVAHSQFDLEVTKSDGFILKRPESWR